MGGFVAPTSFGEPIEIAGVRIAANDLVLADINGVVIVPQNRADEVVHRSRRHGVACCRRLTQSMHLGGIVLVVPNPGASGVRSCQAD